VFHDYAWPGSLPEFARFNLIYGWNGCGKTTLTSIFRAMQYRTAIGDADIELDVDGTAIRGDALHSTPLPEVRVFDRHFVATNVFDAGGEFTPIYVLGEDSVEKQQKVAALRELLTERIGEIVKKQSDRVIAERSLDELCVSQGRTIRELLNTTGQGTYNNYDKGRFKRRAESFNAETAKAAMLSEPDKVSTRALIATKPRDALGKYSISVPDTADLKAKTEALLSKSVVSGILQELAVDADIAAWVQKGLALHTGDMDSNTCRFCGQVLPAERLGALEQHFNDDFKKLQQDVQGLIDSVNATADRLSNQTFYDVSKLYDNLSTDYETAVRHVRDSIATTTTLLDGLASALLMKRENPLLHVQVTDFVDLSELSKLAILHPSIEALNGVVDRHTAQTSNFESELEAARVKLELSIVGEAFPEFETRRKMVASESGIVAALQLDEARLKHEIETIEKDIIEHRRPVEELNNELEAYLGRSELKLIFQNTGYAIMRGGRPAGDLSEGEKTAIGFLYFLKSLMDKSFKLSDGIVVIDDPVSSLDTNSLFCAFGYMRDRTKDAAQLIVLTHNFGFFRQVRSWFRHLPGQKKKNVALRPAQFYLLNAFFKGGHRNAALQPLDPLLHDYESEYHYLFKHVADESSKDGTNGSLEQYYGMPNIARRLLEAFLAFRHPALCGELQEQLSLVAYDEAKKARIIRFLHTFSHKDNIAEGDHDLSILAETRPVLVDVLDLIKEVDGAHHEAMMALIAPPADLPADGHA